MSEFVTKNLNTKQTTKRPFIHLSSDESNEFLSKKYKHERRMIFTIAIEVDDENNILEQNYDAPSHFCVFPLIGSEAHLMPILINSPDFERDSERESLYFQGDDFSEQIDTISEIRINKMVLKESIPLFDKLVCYLASNYHNLYFLA
jgi:hypothetical protein